MLAFALAVLLAAPESPEDAPARPFAAVGRVLGPGYLEVDLAAGYGRPASIWGGAEAYGFVSPNFAAFYGGLRASLLVVDLRGGVRRVVGIAHSFAPAPPAPTLDDFAGAAEAGHTPLPPH